MLQMNPETQKLLNANISVLTKSHDRVTLLALDGLKKKKKKKQMLKLSSQWNVFVYLVISHKW